MRYVAGWNQCGYLPESDPQVFDDFDDAKRYIIDALLWLADNAALNDDETTAEEITNLAEDVNLESNCFEVIHDYWAYWVTEERTEHED